MAHFQSLFKWKNPTVKRLVGWRQSDENEKWTTKAVETLLERLKNKKNSISDLQFALANPDKPSNCVTIPRSADGRIQVSHKKSFPHVVYCKVWRWPDIQTHHEIQAIESCNFAFSKKLEDICINPYHYVRVERPSLPPILVPDFSDLQLLSVPSTSYFMQPPPSTPNISMNLDEQFHNEPANVYPEQQYTSQNCGNSFTNSSPCNSPTYEYTPSNAPPPSYSPVELPTNIKLTPVQYQETPNWATISYYELNQRVGEMFHAKNLTIQVDGFTNPSSDERFSLGVLSNIHRNSIIENTRRHIGNGIQLRYVGGAVFVECISETSVFVQSRLFNLLNNFDLTAVLKLTKGCSTRIFDDSSFATILRSSVNRGYEFVYELTKLCVLRLSFVKGWGSNYHRYDVTSTPCWIEIQIHGALKWLDEVLTQMGSPSNAISSVS